MKKDIVSNIACILFFLNICTYLSAQVKTRTYFNEIPQSKIINSPLGNKMFNIPVPEAFEKLLSRAGSMETSTDYKNKFALVSKTNLDFFQIAQKTVLKDKIFYSLQLKAEKSLNLSLQFGEFLLSKNAIMTIYTAHEITDSITSNENNERFLWATRVYQGDNLNIVVVLPKIEEEVSILRITQAGLGFKKIGPDFFGNPGTSASCNINILCPSGNGWQNERNSVALVVANSDEVGTGTLIMNTCNYNRPYFLTANHMVVNNGNVSNWVFQFQTWSSTCTPNGAFIENVQFNGGEIRAKSGVTDFALIELYQTPLSNSGLTYAGWNRSSVPATSTTAIHHPMGDLMKISHDFQAPVAAPYTGSANDHWRASFDVGIVQRGSSGCALFNQAHQIVGQLHGSVENVCTDFDNNCWCVIQRPSVAEFGRFDLSWIGEGTNETRLSNWLDPSNSGAITTNTTNIVSLIQAANPGAFLPMTGNSVVCATTQTYTIRGFSVGATINWQLLPPIVGSGYQLPAQNVCSMVTNGNQATLTKISNGNVRLVATITYCGGIVQSANKEVTFGVSPIANNGAYASNISWYTPIVNTVHFTNGTTTAISMAFPYNNQYTFTKNQSSSNATWINWANGNVGITFNKPVTSSSFISFNVKTTNACGITNTPLVFYYNGPPIYFRVSPNPANDFITIEEIDAETNKITTQSNIKAVELINKMGVVFYRKEYNKSVAASITIPIRQFKNDIYTVRIFDGKEWQSKKILIQH